MCRLHHCVLWFNLNDNGKRFHGILNFMEWGHKDWIRAVGWSENTVLGRENSSVFLELSLGTPSIGFWQLEINS